MSRWGDEKTLQFVTLYRSNECLWNPRSPLYKNNIARNNAYQEMLINMNDPILTVQIIKTKIKNLRSVYHSEVKKIENSMRSGSGATGVYKPSMPWFQEMHSFIGDTADYRESVASELDSEASSQASQTTDADSNSNPLTPNSINLSSPSTELPMEERPQPRSSSNTSSRRKRSIQEEPMTYALDRLENITSAINRQTEYDEFHYFAQNVAAQLRALPLYEALNVQTEIQAIITAARRRHQCPNLSPFTCSTSNTQTITTLPTTNTQTNTYTCLTSEQEDVLSNAWKLS